MKKIIFTFTALMMTVALFGAEKTAKEYIADLAPAKDEKTIVEASDWLGTKKEKEAVPGLLELLKDSRENVRLHAVMALGYIRDESAVDSINKLMLNDDSSNVRYAALLSSFRIGSKKSIDAWKQSKEKETDPYMKDILKKMEEKARK